MATERVPLINQTMLKRMFRSFKRKHKLTNAQFAQLLCTSTSVVSHLEHGEVGSVSKRVYNHIINALGEEVRACFEPLPIYTSQTREDKMIRDNIVTPITLDLMERERRYAVNLSSKALKWSILAILIAIAALLIHFA